MNTSMTLVAISAAILAALLTALVSWLLWRIVERRLNRHLTDSVHDLRSGLDRHGRRIEELADELKAFEAARAAAHVTFQERLTGLDQRGRRITEELTDGLKKLGAAHVASHVALQERVENEIRTLASRCEHAVSDGISQVSFALAEQSRRFDEMEAPFAELKALFEELKAPIAELRAGAEADRGAAERALRSVQRHVTAHLTAQGFELQRQVSAEIRRLMPPEPDKLDEVSLAALRDIVPGLDSGPSEELDAALLKVAKSLVYVRPLVPYPDWRFDTDWDNPDLSFHMRRYIWTYFNQRGKDVPFTLDWHESIALRLRLGNDLSKLVFVAGCMEPNEFAWLNTVLLPGMTFVDAGANDGLYTLFSARRVAPAGCVLAFEPSQREFERLQENLLVNRMDNVCALRMALADTNGSEELKIADEPNPGQNTLGDFMYPEVSLLRTEVVPVRSLDSVVEERGLRRVDVLKVDVEGAERRVLDGARTVLRDMRPLILFEVSDAGLRFQGSSAEELFDFLRSFGYSLHAFDLRTGRPVPAGSEASGNNMLAIP
jgi:FkbM family methyltransferase